MWEYTFFYCFSLINSKILHLWNFLTGQSATVGPQKKLVNVGSHGQSNSGVSPMACMEILISTSAPLICWRPYPSVGSEQCLSDYPIQQMCCTQPCAYSLRGRRDSNCFTFVLTGTWTLWKGSGFFGSLVGWLVVFFHVFYFFLSTQEKNFVPFRPVDL